MMGIGMDTMKVSILPYLEKKIRDELILLNKPGEIRLELLQDNLSCNNYEYRAIRWQPPSTDWNADPGVLANFVMQVARLQIRLNPIVMGDAEMVDMLVAGAENLLGQLSIWRVRLQACKCQIDYHLWVKREKEMGFALDWRPNETIPEDYYGLD